MATTLSAVVTTRLDSALKVTQTGAETRPRNAIYDARVARYSDGTGANQADLILSPRKRTVTAASETLNFRSTPTFTQEGGTSLAFVELCELYIENLSATSGETLAITGNLQLGWRTGISGDLNIYAGGKMHWSSPIDGFAVGTGAAGQLTIDPGADTIDYLVWAIGRTA